MHLEVKCDERPPQRSVSASLDGADELHARSAVPDAIVKANRSELREDHQRFGRDARHTLTCKRARRRAALHRDRTAEPASQAARQPPDAQPPA